MLLLLSCKNCKSSGADWHACTFGTFNHVTGKRHRGLQQPPRHTFESPKETRLLASYGGSKVWCDGLLQATVIDVLARNQGNGPSPVRRSIHMSNPNESSKCRCGMKLLMLVLSKWHWQNAFSFNISTKCSDQKTDFSFECKHINGSFNFSTCKVFARMKFLQDNLSWLPEINRTFCNFFRTISHEPSIETWKSGYLLLGSTALWWQNQEMSVMSGDWHWWSSLTMKLLYDHQWWHIKLFMITIMTLLTWNISPSGRKSSHIFEFQRVPWV